jgi:hypothetical protein
MDIAIAIREIVIIRRAGIIFRKDFDPTPMIKRININNG